MIDTMFGDDNETPIVKVYETTQKVVSNYLNKEHKTIEFLAAKLNTTKGYLYANLDPNQMNKPLSIDKVYKISKITEDAAIFEAILDDLGFLVVPKEHAKITDASMKELAIAVQIECNDVFSSVMKSLDDEKISKKEQEINAKEIKEAMAKLAELEKLNNEIEIKE